MANAIEGGESLAAHGPADHVRIGGGRAPITFALNGSGSSCSYKFNV
jgi:hypothetical protein